ncbi:MAG: GNAT family N-acetyltransferase [Chloroflexota bacterium]|nr:GNAT family N-acetyltransferase [Chloroflexota bacterium]
MDPDAPVGGVRSPAVSTQPRLETERLILRPFDLGDWAGLHRAYGDPEVMRWHGLTDQPPIEETAFAAGRMAGHFTARGYGMFAIVEREAGEIVGRVGIMVHDDWTGGPDQHEIGWTVQRDRWGRGYATESARAVMDWIWEVVDVSRIISITDLENLRSQRVMEKLGLTRRGTARWHEHDVVWYAIERPAKG